MPRGFWKMSRERIIIHARWWQNTFHGHVSVKSTRRVQITVSRMTELCLPGSWWYGRVMLPIYQSRIPLWSTFFANCRKPTPPGALQHISHQDIEKQNGEGKRISRQQSFRASAYFSISPPITLKPNVSRRLPVRIRISPWRDFLSVLRRVKMPRRARENHLNASVRLISVYPLPPPFPLLLQLFAFDSSGVKLQLIGTYRRSPRRFWLSRFLVEHGSRLRRSVDGPSKGGSQRAANTIGAP